MGHNEADDETVAERATFVGRWKGSEGPKYDIVIYEDLK
jgi:hypothetical protein